MGMNFMQAHNQWASRPADERFWNIGELTAALSSERPKHEEKLVRMGSMRAEATGKDLSLVGPHGGKAKLSHFAFGQLCTDLQAPAGFLRELTSDTAVKVVNERMGQLGDDSSKLLMRAEFDDNGKAIPDSALIRGYTGPKYGRIWNLNVCNALAPALANGWMTPPARPSVTDPRTRPATETDIFDKQGTFGLSVKVGDPIAPAGVYCGDKDMFVLLAHPDRVIDSKGDGFIRAVMFGNSEVGGRAFWACGMLLENICGNHILWGISASFQIKIVHRVNAPLRFAQSIGPQLRKLADLNTAGEANMIDTARRYVLADGKDMVVERLQGIKNLGLTSSELSQGYDYAEQWEHTARCNPNTAWGYTHGLTRYSQTRQNMDDRTRIDKAGGKILALSTGNAIVAC